MKILYDFRIRAGAIFITVLLAIFILLLLKNSGLYPIVLSDENTYSKFSRLLPFSSSTIPGYIYLGIYRLTNHCGADFLACSRLFNTFFFVATAPFIYLVARRVTTLGPAIFISALSLLAPINSYTAYFMPEAFYFFGFWIFTWFVLRLDNSSIRDWAIAGAIFGCTALIKPHSFLFAPAIFIFAGYLTIRSGRGLNLFTTNVICFIVASLIVKLMVGYWVAGKYGFSIFGTAYTEIATSTTSNTQRYLELVTIAISSIKGHILALLLMFGPGLVLAFHILLKAIVSRRETSPQETLSILTLLLLSNLVAVAGLFTASVTNAGPYETATRLHMRYYDFVFPLIFIVAASQLHMVDVSRRKWRAVIASIMAIPMLYAAWTGMTPYTPNFVDSPELYGFIFNPALLYILSGLMTASLGVWVYSTRIGARFFVYLVMPLSIVVSTFHVTQEQRKNLIADDYVKAALFTKQYLGAEDVSTLMILSTDLVGMYKTLFLLDNPYGMLKSVGEGEDYNIADLPEGRKWILVIGEHVVNGDKLFKLEMPGFSLIRGEEQHVIDFNRSTWPGVIRMRGFSSAEAWGTWSSAPEVTIEFSRPLPKKFSINLTGHAFGPNIDKEFIAHVGDNSLGFTLGSKDSEKELNIDNPGRSNVIRITIPSATSPLQLGIGEDRRLLGIGLIKLSITPL